MDGIWVGCWYELFAAQTHTRTVFLCLPFEMYLTQRCCWKIGEGEADAQSRTEKEAEKRLSCVGIFIISAVG